MIWLLVSVVMVVLITMRIWITIPRRNCRGHRLARWMAIHRTLQ